MKAIWKMEVARLRQQKIFWIVLVICASMSVLVGYMQFSPTLANVQTDPTAARDSIVLMHRGNETNIIQNVSTKVDLIPQYLVGNLLIVSIIICMSLFVGNFYSSGFYKNIFGVIADRRKIVLVNYLLMCIVCFVLLLTVLISSLFGSIIGDAAILALPFGNVGSLLLFMVKYYYFMCVVIAFAIFVTHWIRRTLIALVLLFCYGTSIVQSGLGQLLNIRIEQYTPIGILLNLEHMSTAPLLTFLGSGIFLIVLLGLTMRMKTVQDI